SGWQYDWNPNGFDWFVKNSGLNAVELNASFYRFPFPSMVISWIRKTKQFNPKLRWAIKVNRLITHVFKFSDRAFSTWKKFENLFKPLAENIDFYLFQLPPNTKSNFAPKLEKFIKQTELEEKFALEVRNLDWFDQKWIEWAKDLKITWVSVDAPDFTNFPREIYKTSTSVYLRMHGRTDWYSHNYSEEELEEVAEKIFQIKPQKIYVFFNNDHNM
ncbi:MAG: DUF72 domain-containing protein, partial [Candidatus Aenigmarchaeota archaeon]|nr:DUF72 domain-containing protein [Candidatus Aenigmarchaeota archaeon]